MSEVSDCNIKLAEAATQRGDWAKAQAHYEAALTADPQDQTLAAALQQAKEAWKESAALAGRYETTSQTPVLKKPRGDAAVITSLSPGTKVSVVGAIGDYLRVQSRKGNPPGYIARKDVAPDREGLESTGGKQQAALERPGTGTAQRPTMGATCQEEARAKLEQMGIPYNERAFFEKVCKHNIPAVKLFLAAGVDPNVKLIDSTALMCAVAGDMSAARTASAATMVKLLLNNGADVNAKGTNGQTALMIAANHGFTEAVLALLAKGADVNATDNKGETALMWARQNSQYRMVALLRRAGAWR